MNHLDSEKDFSIIIGNKSNQKMVINYDAKLKEFQIDRSKSGIINFDKGFSGIIKAPRFSTSKWMDIKLVIDKTSVEVFADNGLTVMTAIYFPTELYNTIHYKLPEGSSRHVYALN
jgi:fructan beta-fructosidase